MLSYYLELQDSLHSKSMIEINLTFFSHVELEIQEPSKTLKSIFLSPTHKLACIAKVIFQVFISKR